MEQSRKLTYEPPVTDTVETKAEGIICDSENFDEGHDED